MATTTEKPWYKKTKVLVTLGGIVLTVLTNLLGDKLSPEYQEIAATVMYLTIALLTGHTLTDVAAMFKKTK